MNPDGSNVRRLSKNYAGGLMFEPVWSPDSRTLAFIVWDGPGAFSDKTATPEGKDGREQWDSNSFKGTNIHLVDVETGEERRLLPDTGNIDPAWSPDGRQIAYASTRSGGAQIWVVNADGTNLRQVTQESRWVRYPVWRGATKP
jgi:TolB protein